MCLGGDYASFIKIDLGFSFRRPLDVFQTFHKFRIMRSYYFRSRTYENLLRPVPPSLVRPFRSCLLTC